MTKPLIYIRFQDSGRPLDAVYDIMRFLVADREHLIRWFLVRVLTRNGHKTTTASNRRDAHNLIGRNDIDAVIAELGILETEDAAGYIHECLPGDKKIHAVACSAFIGKDKEEELRTRGIHMLRKPFNIAQIENILSRFV